MYQSMQVLIGSGFSVEQRLQIIIVLDCTWSYKDTKNRYAEAILYEYS
jgi:hypothetical protein